MVEEKKEKIGIWRKQSVRSLKEELEYARYDFLLAESDEGRRIGLGDGFQVFLLKNTADNKLKIGKQLEAWGWGAWGYNAYLLTGVPLRVIKTQFQKLFPKVIFSECDDLEAVA